MLFIKISVHLIFYSSCILLGSQNSKPDRSVADRSDYALIFATDNYENWDNLVSPTRDAKAIANELRNTYGFQTEVLENNSMEEVLLKIRAYRTKNFEANDQLFIFFAGHGFFDEQLNMGFLVSTDSKSEQGRNKTSIAFADLTAAIDSIPINHILLTMDVCRGMPKHAQQAVPRGRGQSYENLNRKAFIELQLKNKTRRYLTAGGESYSEDQRAGSSSILSGKVLKALQSKGGGDGLLTLQEFQRGMVGIEIAPRAGSFGSDYPGSNFLFIVNRN